MRWTCAHDVHRLDLFVSPREDAGYRGTWTAVDERELTPMLGWLQAAGLRIVPTGATAATTPRWPEGVVPL